MVELPEVLFDEDTHTYTQAGVVVPRSVTGLLKKYGLTDDFSAVPPRVVEIAKQRGIAYAAGRALLLQGFELDPSTIHESVQPYIKAFTDFWRDSEAKVIETEIPHVSPLGFGFKSDILCWVAGRRLVIDDKCTYSIPKSAGPQTAGYAIGYRSIYGEQGPEGRAVLHIKKDGTYKFKELEDPDDETAFMDCLNADLKLTQWQKKYGGKP